MNKKEKDRHLDAPAEANRDKHINFIAEERGEVDPAQEKVKGALNNRSISPRNKQKKIVGSATTISNEQSGPAFRQDHF